MTVMYTAAGPLQGVLNELIRRICQVTQPRRILLFGSAVRDQIGKDSDVDLLVIVRGLVHRRALAQEIYRNLHGVSLPVDVIVATEEDVEQYGDSVRCCPSLPGL